MYNTAAIICQGTKADTDPNVLKAKLSLNWTGPYKVLAVGPCNPACTPDGSSVGATLLYFDLPSDMPGVDARRRVSVQPCKPCANSHDDGNMPKYVASGVDAICAQEFLRDLSPYHVTQDDVSIPL